MSFVGIEDEAVLLRCAQKNGFGNHFRIGRKTFEGIWVDHHGSTSIQSCLMLEHCGREWAFSLGTWCADASVDIQSRDATYWKGIFSRLRSVVFLHVAARAGIGNLRELKEWRHEARMRAVVRGKTYAERYGADVMAWVNGRLVEASKDCDFVDNERIACLRRRKDVRRYWRQKKQGCCGEHDEVVVHPSGLPFLIGFNFGH